MPCIHRNVRWHFLNCGIVQTPSPEPIPGIFEGFSPWRGFPGQPSAHRPSSTEQQVHLVCLSLPHQAQPTQQQVSNFVYTQKSDNKTWQTSKTLTCERWMHASNSVGSTLTDSPTLTSAPR